MSFLPILSRIGTLFGFRLPVLAPAIVIMCIAGLLFAGHRVAVTRSYARGIAEEKARNISRVVEETALAQARAAKAELKSQTADAAAVRRIGHIREQELRHVENVRILYRDRPDPVCVDADGMRLIEEADDARETALTARGGAYSLSEARPVGHNDHQPGY